MRRSVGWFKRFSLGLTFELSLKGDVYKTKHTSKKRHKPNFDFTLNYFHRSRELALKPALLRSDVISAVWPETMFAVKCVLQMLDWMHLLVIYLQTYLLFNIVLPSFMIYCPIFFQKCLCNSCWQFHILLMWFVIDKETEELALFSSLPEFIQSLQIKCCLLLLTGMFPPVRLTYSTSFFQRCACFKSLPTLARCTCQGHYKECLCPRGSYLCRLKKDSNEGMF